MIRKIKKEDIPLKRRRRAAEDYLRKLRAQLSLPNLTEPQRKQIQGRLKSVIESLRG